MNFLDKRKKEDNDPCSMAVTDRRGVHFTVPYPCNKYVKKETWKKKCCHKRGANQAGMDYEICVPKERNQCPKKVVCEQKVCPGEKFYTCRSEQRSGDRIQKCYDCKAEKCDDGKKLVISIPGGDCGRRDIPLGNVRIYLPPEEKPKPGFHQKDYAYRCESRELLGSKLLTYCLCVRRNGLQVSEITRKLASFFGFLKTFHFIPENISVIRT